MSTDFEAKHPRGDGGQFAHAPHSEADGVELDAAWTDERIDEFARDVEVEPGSLADVRRRIDAAVGLGVGAYGPLFDT